MPVDAAHPHDHHPHIEDQPHSPVDPVDDYLGEQQQQQEQPNDDDGGAEPGKNLDELARATVEASYTHRMSEAMLCLSLALHRIMVEGDRTSPVEEVVRAAVSLSLGLATLANAPPIEGKEPNAPEDQLGYALSALSAVRDSSERAVVSIVKWGECFDPLISDVLRVAILMPVHPLLFAPNYLGLNFVEDDSSVPAVMLTFCVPVLRADCAMDVVGDPSIVDTPSSMFNDLVSFVTVEEMTDERLSQSAIIARDFGVSHIEGNCVVAISVGDADEAMMSTYHRSNADNESMSPLDQLQQEIDRLMSGEAVTDVTGALLQVRQFVAAQDLRIAELSEVHDAETAGASMEAAGNG